MTDLKGKMIYFQYKPKGKKMIKFSAPMLEVPLMSMSYEYLVKHITNLLGEFDDNAPFMVSNNKNDVLRVTSEEYIEAAQPEQLVEMTASQNEDIDASPKT